MTQKAQQKKQPHILYRSEDDKVLAGVSSGIGEYMNIDPTIIRILFLFLAIFGGSGIIIYLALWLIIPRKSKIKKSGSDTIKGNIEEMKLTAKTTFQSHSSSENNRSLLAIILVGLGVLFLFDNLNILQFDFGKFWPILLIILGIIILRRR